jgi:DNA polymerase elongation subunit (family B)
MTPRILLVDIETAPNKCYTWGLWDQNIAFSQVEESSYVLCWSAKWLGSKDMMFASVQKQTPTGMLKGIYALLSEADVVIHYNGSKFDIPTLNKEFIQYGFAPPAPYKQLDLLKACRKAFRFQSNKMTNVTKALGIGEKVKHEGFELWVKCMKGDLEAWKKMEHYNRGDVRLLESLYKRILPWIEHHPNLSVYQNKPACSNCGSLHVQRRGKEVAILKWYARFHCQDCGKWFKGEAVAKDTK